MGPPIDPVVHAKCLIASSHVGISVYKMATDAPPRSAMSEYHRFGPALLDLAMFLHEGNDRRLGCVNSLNPRRRQGGLLTASDHFHARMIGPFQRYAVLRAEVEEQ